jgi:hypothetical protein
MPIQGIEPFERTSIRFAPSGGTVVEWELSRLFTDKGPYTFTLQGSSSSGTTADFASIGLPAVNAFFLVDDEARLFGKELDWFYRIKLVTYSGTYYSPVIYADSGVDYRTWRIVREILRKETLRMQRFVSVPDTVLFKRKRIGTKCTRCADPLTDEPIDGNCQVCLGTGLIAGYYAAVPILVDMQVSNETEQQDVQKVGTSSQAATQNCRIISDAVLSSQDVIWDKGSGRRYIVHEYTELITMRGYNIVAAVNLRMAPFSDVVYTIEENGI